jgi:hypothetical protein
MKPLALFQVSMTCSPSWISRRRGSDDRYWHRKSVFWALPSSASAR